MKASDLRLLQPFITAVEGYAAALAPDTSSCRCILTPAGRWHQPDGGCPLAVVHGEAGEGDAPGSCRTIVHVVLRWHLLQLRLPVDHINDPELDEAVAQLHALTLRGAHLSTDEFADGIQRALHADRVAADTLADLRT